VSVVDTVVGVAVDELSAVVTRSGHSVTLGCVINTSERIRAEIAWYKDEQRIDDDGGEHYSISRNETKSMLNITRVCQYHTHTHTRTTLELQRLSENL